MKSKKDASIRLIVGALLTSNLTTREIMGIAKIIRNDPSWPLKLSDCIIDVINITNAQINSPKHLYYQETENVEYMADDLLRAFKAKGIAKKNALKLLYANAKGLQWKPNQNKSLRENIIQLLNFAELDGVATRIHDQIFDYLNVRKDPYLRELL